MHISKNLIACSILTLSIACSSINGRFGNPRSPTSSGSLSNLKVIDLSDYRGETYFNFVTSEKGLKKRLLDPEYHTEFIPANRATLKQATDNFDPSVYHKVLAQFAQQELGLEQLNDELSTQKHLAQSNLNLSVSKILEEKGLPANPQKINEESAVVTPFLGLASGSGVSVIINRDNYFFSYGYKVGGSRSPTLEKDLKSGKNFSASPGHKALDTSEEYYLRELEVLMSDKKESRDFFRVFLMTLLECDSSEQVRLSISAQTVLTDFLSLYTTELNRHAMTDFTKHSWENDLAELTMLTAFSAEAGIIPSKKSLTRGHQMQFLSGGPNGKSLLESRPQRRNFQLALHKVIKQMHPNLVAKIEGIIPPVPGADLIHTVISFLNNPTNQSLIKSNNRALVESLTEYLSILHDESDKITSAGLQKAYAKLATKNKIID